MIELNQSQQGGSNPFELPSNDDYRIVQENPLFSALETSSRDTNVVDFSPVLRGEVSINAPAKVSAPASFDGNLPSLGISHGTDLFLPDVQLALVDKSVSVNAPANARIADAAEKNDGTQPWTDTKYTPNVQNGRLAGAAAVSTILQDLGYKGADSANVGKLSDQLIKEGWQMVPLDKAQPGDVIYGGRLGKDWRAGGGNAHVGIIGKDGEVWHNDSATGNWQKDSVASSFPEGKYGNQVWVLRPPPEVPNTPAPDGPVRPNRPGPRPDNRPGPDYRPRPDDYTPRPGDDTRVRPEDDRPDERGERTNAEILKNSKNSVDKRLWWHSDFRNSVKGGRLGCAASVSEVLKASGYRYANSAGVGGLVGILQQNGWEKVPLSQAQPGDVVYAGKPGTRWWEGGGNAHIGVVGEDGQVFHNSSGQKRWVEDKLTSVFNTKRFGDNRWVLRPPRNA